MRYVLTILIAIIAIIGFTSCEELQEATEKVDDKPIEQPIGDNEPTGTPSGGDTPIIDGNIAIPTGLTVAGETTTSITLTWTASSNIAVTGYKLYQTIIPTIHPDGYISKPSEERKKKFKKTIDVAGRSTATHTLTFPLDLDNFGSTFSYTITAVAGSKESTQSKAVTATIFPQPPKGFTAEAGTNSVKLTWTASSDTAVIGYWISQTVDSTTTSIDVEGRSTATYTVTGLTAGKEYSFTITKWVNAGGGPADTVRSAPSTAVTATPKPAITIDTNIATPEEVVAFPDAGKISLSWKVSSDTNVTGYKIYQDGTLIHTVPYRIPTIPHRMRPPTRVEYDVTGLTNGKEYSFTVSAVVGSSESAQSTAVTATPTTTPAPTGLSATAGMEQVVLNWTLSSDTSVTGYKIYQDSNKTGIAVSGRETITHTVTGLTAGTEYSFTITAIAGSSESAQSAPVKATPR